MSNKQVLIMSYTEKVDLIGTKYYYKDGVLHRDGDEPAIIWSSGTKWYYKDGVLHRDGDEPAIIWSSGPKKYYKNGKLHRDGDEPAVIGLDGTKWYCKNGELHRDRDEPAVIWSDGSVEYYKNGKLHRDGYEPAAIYLDGNVEYYKYGVRYTKEQVEKMEEMRTRMVNKIAVKYARYWYDETYRDTEGKAFKARMMRDMDYLENEIGYKFSDE